MLILKMVELGSRKLNRLTLRKHHPKPFANVRPARIVRNNKKINRMVESRAVN